MKTKPKKKETITKRGGFTYVDGKFTRVEAAKSLLDSVTTGYQPEHAAVRDELRYLSGYTCAHSH